MFEAVPTKLPHYTLPLYPAIMLLAAHAALSAGKPPKWLHWLAAIPLAVTALGLTTGDQFTSNDRQSE